RGVDPRQRSEQTDDEEHHRNQEQHTADDDHVTDSVSTGTPITGQERLELRAQHPSGSAEAHSVSEPLSNLAPKTSDGQAEKPPAGVPSSLSPSGSRGGPAGASAPGSTSSTSGGGEELNGLAGAD